MREEKCQIGQREPECTEVYDCQAALRAPLKFEAMNLKGELVMMVVCFLVMFN